MPRLRPPRSSLAVLVSATVILGPRHLMAQSEPALPLQGQPIYTTPTGSAPGIGQPFAGGQLGQPLQPQSMMMGGQFMTGNPLLDAYQARTNQMMMRSLARSAQAAPRQTPLADPPRSTGLPSGLSPSPEEVASNTVVQPGAGGGRPPLRTLGGQRLTPYQLCERDGGCPGLSKSTAPADSMATPAPGRPPGN